MESTSKDGQDNLRCELTDAELLEYGRQQARALSDKDNVEDELKSFQTAIKNKMAILDATINSVSEKIRNGYEFRYVNTQIETNFDEELVKFWRKDTNECYRQRLLNSEERQLLLGVQGTEE